MSPQPFRPSRWLLPALGIAQIVAWGSIYYLFALLLDPLQQDLHASKQWVVGAFSAALLVSGMCAPWIGRTIDRYGGRAVMTVGALAGVLLLVALSRVHGLLSLYVVWIGLGFVMAATLYEPAFVVVTQLFHTDYRRAITLLTLFGGFASTVFWPLTTGLMQHLGWRDAVLALAAVNLLINVPLLAWVLPATRPTWHAATEASAAAGEQRKTIADAYADPRFYALAFATLASALVVAALGVHLIAVLLARGLSPTAAAVIGSLFGPMQVAGRVAELAVSGRWRASQIGRIAVLALPAALLLLLFAGADVALLVGFSLLYGASNGVMTIVRGTLPVELYGRAHYGATTGALALPGLVARAAGPLVAALLWSSLGGYDAVILALAAIAVLGAAAFYLATARRERRITPAA